MGEAERARWVARSIAYHLSLGLAPINLVDGPWARWLNQRRETSDAFAISQRKRKLDEEIFGWLKQFGGLRRARVTGRWKIQQLADLALATLNLVRMRSLLRT